MDYEREKIEVLPTDTTSENVINYQINQAENMPQPAVGLNVLTTCVFIVGVIAGSGFLTLPKAIEDTGWIGFVLVLFCCLMSAYTADILGECWNLVCSRHPEFKKGQDRYPYPTIGFEAYGNLGRYIISVSIDLTNFGASVVYVLLAAENIVTLLPDDSKFNCCYVTIMVVGVMTPFTWLGTPKDFWGIAAAATLVTSAASLVLFIYVLYNRAGINVSEVTHTDVSIVSFFMAYGTICFAFNGHSTFPTFQSDMANPKKFGTALLLGYIFVLLMYMPSSAAAYALYGSEVQANILNTVPRGPASTTVSVLITAHLLFAIVIVINPVSQELEHLFKIPEKFTWKRVCSRTVTMLAVLFMATSVPHFSSILSLVGGSTVSILSFICPPLFYIKLCQTTGEHKGRFIPLHIKVLLIEIMCVGLVAGVAATYSAINDLAVNKFTVPCYVNPTKACFKS